VASSHLGDALSDGQLGNNPQADPTWEKSLDGLRNQAFTQACAFHSPALTLDPKILCVDNGLPRGNASPRSA